MSRRLTPEELDMRVLMANAAFRRFLLQIGSMSGIWIPTAGAEQFLPYREGQRSLGLEIFRKAAAGLPQRDAGPEHVLAAIHSDTTPQETDDAEPQDESELRR